MGGHRPPLQSESQRHTTTLGSEVKKPRSADRSSNSPAVSKPYDLLRRRFVKWKMLHRQELSAPAGHFRFRRVAVPYTFETTNTIVPFRFPDFNRHKYLYLLRWALAAPVVGSWNASCTWCGIWRSSGSELELSVHRALWNRQLVAGHLTQSGLPLLT